MCPFWWLKTNDEFRSLFFNHNESYFNEQQTLFNTTYVLPLLLLLNISYKLSVQLTKKFLIRIFCLKTKFTRKKVVRIFRTLLFFFINKLARLQVYLFGKLLPVIKFFVRFKQKIEVRFLLFFTILKKNNSSKGLKKRSKSIERI